MTPSGVPGFLPFRLALGLVAAACALPGQPNSPLPASLDPSADEWVETTLASLDLEGRVAQMFAVHTGGRLLAQDPDDWPRVMDHVKRLGVGGITFFQGAPEEQAALVNQLQREAAVPLLVSQDMEWGAGMRVDGASRYPVAMAIAATRDPALAYEAGYGTALEARALGVHQIFAPVADVNANPRNPVISTRAFSDRADLTAEYVAAFVRGAQDGGVLATVKHFPGHGGTSSDSHETLPVVWSSRTRIDSLDLVPFRSAMEAGVAGVMTAHVAFPGLGDPDDLPATFSRRIVTGMLRDSLRFDGLILTDALNMDGIEETGSPAELAVWAVEAGVDMLLMSTDVESAHAAVVAAVRSGRIDERRIEKSVIRILRAKASLGLHLRPVLDLGRLDDVLHSGPQRALETIIAQRSLTLVAGSILPEHTGSRVLVVALSERDDEEDLPVVRRLIREQPGVSFDVVTVDARSAARNREALVRRARTYSSIVTLAFLSASTWEQRPGAAIEYRRLLAGLSASGRRHTLVVFGTPYLAAALDPSPQGVILAWDRSEAMQIAAAQALVGRLSVTGRLPITLSATLPVGFGLDQTASGVRETEPEALGLDGATIALTDSLIDAAIRDRAFPGAAVVIGRGDAVALGKGYGRFTYDSGRQVTPSSPFDLASLTKVVATTTALMLLFDQGKIRLEDPVARYVPEFGRNGKDRVTIRHLLTHSGGLIPFRAFHRMGVTTRRALLEAIFNESLEYEPGTESRYSDFGPIMLALVVERVTGQPFDHFVRESVFEPLGMGSTGYRPTGRPDPAAVPTEIDDTFRKRLLQGEVHDETAWILGGTAGHAGLFSTADDLARFAAMMASEGRVGGRVFIRPETVRLFTTRADTTGPSTRALGWDTRALPGDGPASPSSAGTLFGPRSFGHTGFTGTSLWIDPDAGLFVILLSNRVYPTRNNTRHGPVRSALADLAHGALRSQEPILPSSAADRVAPGRGGSRTASPPGGPSGAPPR